MRVPMPKKVVLASGLALAVTPGLFAGPRDWQVEARRRIETLRQGQLRIQVLDRAGNAVEGAAVHVQQTRHAFRFGTAVATHRLVEPGAENEKYREMLKRHFTMASPENDLKWGPWDGEFDPERFGPRYKPQDFSREKAVAGLRWLKANDFFVRGHTLVWPSWRRTPRFLGRFKEDPAGLLAILRDHIEQETAALADYINEWDVVNEPVLHNELLQIFKPEVMADWFRITRAVLPRTPLFLNETNLVAGQQDLETSRRTLDRYLQILMANDAPLDGLGIQGHVRWERRISISEILAYLDHVRELGLPVTITEFDMRGCTEQESADYTRDFYTAAFSHPAVKGIQMWGFWEGDIVRPEFASFRTDWSPRANGQAYLDLVFKEWWTDAQGTSGRDGLFKTRAFYGDYDVTVRLGERSATKKARIPEGVEARSVVLELP